MLESTHAKTFWRGQAYSNVKVTLDMNWHTKDGWTGFSWDRQLFPYPNDTLAELHIARKERLTLI